MGFADFGRGLGINNFKLKEHLRLKRLRSKVPRLHGHPEQLDPKTEKKYQRIEKEMIQKMIFRVFLIISFSVLILLFLYYKYMN